MKKIKNKEAFTLIELLAVIVILGIIALIATPIVLTTIEKAKKGAFQDGVYGVMYSAELYVATNDFKYPVTFTYPESESPLKLRLKGEKPTEGYVQVLKSGKIDLKVGNGSYCATKKEYEENVTVVKGKCDGESLRSPILTGYGEPNQEVELNQEYILPTVIATDYRGNIIEVKREIKTNNTIVDKITTNVLKQVYTITYTAIDENTNLSSSVTITLKVVDKTKPVIEVLDKTEDQTLNEEASITKTYVIPTAKVTDNSGEKITPIVSGSVNLQIPDTYIIKYQAIDSSGNITILTLTVIVKDTKKPTVNYTLNPNSPDGLNNWYKNDITVGLSGTDDETGIKAYEYALNTGGTYGSYQKVTGTSFIISTESSSMQFKVRSKDMVGNTSEEKESPILKLDKTKPAITITTLDPNTWTSGSVKVAIVGTDNVSGIKEYSFDEGLTWQSGNNKTFSSNQTIKVMIKDNAGNTSISSSIVIDKIETVKPTVEFNVVGTPFNVQGWANTNFNINVIPHVGSSGLKSYSYCMTTGATCNPLTSLTGLSQAVTIGSESSTVKLCVEARDNANNTSGVVCSSAYKLDKTAPNFSNLTITKTAAYYNNLDTTLGISASDANTIQMNISNSSYGSGTWENYVSSKGWNVGGALNGTYRTVYVQVRDLAGNVSSKAIGYTPYSECSVTTDTNFGGWGACSATCGGGIQYAYGQKIDNYTGAYCGSATKSQSCNTQSCSIDTGGIVNIGGCTMMDGMCYFRGSNPNNWVYFNNELWRMIGVENGQIKLVRNDLLSAMPFSSNNSDYGAYKIKNYLESNWYNNLSVSIKSKISGTSWNIGDVNYSSTPAAIKAEEAEAKMTSPVGLINASDYAYVSMNASCQSNALKNQNCRLSNWLYVPNRMLLTMNGRARFSSYRRIMEVEGPFPLTIIGIGGPCRDEPYVTGGFIGIDYCSEPGVIRWVGARDYALWTRPVIYLTSSVTFAVGGLGTQSNPYVVQ